MLPGDHSSRVGSNTSGQTVTSVLPERSSTVTAQNVLPAFVASERTTLTMPAITTSRPSISAVISLTSADVWRATVIAALENGCSET